MTTQRKKPAPAAGREFAVDLPRRVFRRIKRIAPLPFAQPGKEEMARRMQRFELFAPLPAKVLSELVAAAKVQAFRAGEYIWHHNEADSRVMFIEQGFVKAARRNSEGVSRTYGLYGPGDSMGIFAIWAGMKYPTDAVSMNDAMTAIFIDTDAMLKFAEKYPRLAGPLRVEIGHFTEAFIRKIEIVSAGTVPQRLAVLMTQLIDRYGVEKKGSKARLPITLTLEQISEIVGVRLETVARIMSGWKKAGWLTIDSNGCHFACLDKVRELLAD
ncbi:MAG: Crp/Fnr family transcriptional regulator [Betaproteobacteria bacterium]|nr:Crp/Fnr family transcriptional regulator [Betaproteobacteria bacterium]